MRIIAFIVTGVLAAVLPASIAMAKKQKSYDYDVAIDPYVAVTIKMDVDSDLRAAVGKTVRLIPKECDTPTSISDENQKHILATRCSDGSGKSSYYVTATKTALKKLIMKKYETITGKIISRNWFSGMGAIIQLDE